MDDIRLGFFVYNFHNSSFDLIFDNTVILLTHKYIHITLFKLGFGIARES